MTFTIPSSCVVFPCIVRSFTHSEQMWLRRLRLSLGLKPLSMTSQADEADKARRQQAEAKRLEEQKRLEGERLAARVKE